MNIEIKTGVYTYKNKEKTFVFFSTLRTSEKMSFVKSVTDSLVNINYYSFIKDLIFDFRLIQFLTDIDLKDFINNTDNDNTNDVSIDFIEEFLAETKIMDVVKSNVEYGLIEELKQAVDENIEYKTGIHKNPIVESLSSLLNTIENKVMSIDTEGMSKAANILGSMSSEFTMDNLLDAYSKSDLFKENQRVKKEKREQYEKELDEIAKAVKKSKKNNDKKIIPMN